MEQEPKPQENNEKCPSCGEQVQIDDHGCVKCEKCGLSYCTK